MIDLLALQPDVDAPMDEHDERTVWVLTPPAAIDLLLRLDASLRATRTSRRAVTSGPAYVPPVDPLTLPCASLTSGRYGHPDDCSCARPNSVGRLTPPTCGDGGHVLHVGDFHACVVHNAHGLGPAEIAASMSHLGCCDPHDRASSRDAHRCDCHTTEAGRLALASGKHVCSTRHPCVTRSHLGNQLVTGKIEAVNPGLQKRSPLPEPLDTPEIFVLDRDDPVGYRYLPSPTTSHLDAEGNHDSRFGSRFVMIFADPDSHAARPDPPITTNRPERPERPGRRPADQPTRRQARR